MKAIIQRVLSASVEIDKYEISAINKGFLIFLGIEKNDRFEDLVYLVNKTSGIRVFKDDNSFMNLSIKDVNGEALVVSQFTLCADTRKGRRPSFTNAAKPEIAEKTYEKFCLMLQQENITVKTGKFGAMMDVKLINDGPVTLLLDSQNIK